MQDRTTRLLIDMIDETVKAMKASVGYEQYRTYDDIFYLPETDRARFHCLLDVYERYTGRELLPGHKDKKLDSLSWIRLDDIDFDSILKTLKRGSHDGRRKENARFVGFEQRTGNGD